MLFGQIDVPRVEGDPTEDQVSVMDRVPVILPEELGEVGTGRLLQELGRIVPRVLEFAGVECRLGKFRQLVDPLEELADVVVVGRVGAVLCARCWGTLALKPLGRFEFAKGAGRTGSLFGCLATAA